jgi:hypothetical protein
MSSVCTGCIRIRPPFDKKNPDGHCGMYIISSVFQSFVRSKIPVLALWLPSSVCHSCLGWPVHHDCQGVVAESPRVSSELTILTSTVLCIWIWQIIVYYKAWCLSCARDYACSKSTAYLLPQISWTIVDIKVIQKIVLLLLGITHISE